LRYTDNDLDVGVRHLQDLGVRYLMVRTDAAKQEAVGREDLELITTSGPWEIYEVVDSAIVTPLAVQPVVVNGRGGDQRERHLEVGTSWFQQRDLWPAMPADSGPEEWQRVDAVVDLDARIGEPDARSRNVDIVAPSEPIDVVELDEIAVSNVRIGEESVRFEVDQIGVPVLVRVSYFPNWSVQGAAGPYRIGPNQMVVIPTSNEVVLTYGRTALDWFFYGLTGFGILLCFYWRRRGDVVYADDRPGDDSEVVGDGDGGPAPGDDTAEIWLDDELDNEWGMPTAPPPPASAAPDLPRDGPDGR
jgi:hypothetical protein